MNPSVEPTAAEDGGFTTEALISAASAFGGIPGGLHDWGAGILDAVEGSTDERGRLRANPALMRTFRSTARFLQQPITPFDGMLEAPDEVIAVFQANKAGLHDLRSTRTDVLTAVLEDLAESVMDQLRGATWHDLEMLGVDRRRPPQASTSPEEDC